MGRLLHVIVGVFILGVCGAATDQQINVHLVPHSHDDGAHFSCIVIIVGYQRVAHAAFGCTCAHVGVGAVGCRRSEIHLLNGIAWLSISASTILMKS